VYITVNMTELDPRQRGSQKDTDVKQIPPHAWPSGDSKHIAVVRFNPEHFMEKFGLQFENELDGLDYFQLAAVELPDGSQTFLTRYAHEVIDPGTIFSIDSQAEDKNAQLQITEIFTFTEKDFIWTSEEHPKTSS
jgi:hypothetical protein